MRVSLTSRFLFRSRMVKKTAQLMNHLLFMKLTAVEGPGRVEGGKQLGLHWPKERRSSHVNVNLLSPIEQV